MNKQTLKPAIKKDDLQTFILLFDPGKYKRLKNGIELRGQPDLERNVAAAKLLIFKLKLNLMVISNANMATYRAFEVNNI
ncbi:hypothetical protein AQ505_20460 [Pedobacter sp. PACM 27299]|uniref:hypothetical protein n=1 Tax=Pedobacter sp. PACM 27299 TaxID=1727164 RepID=UPI0007066CBD|nr:hypothetical protein [Pedobacter sp. PACM 27299]ALL07652.1 hypothetical protein AQ505_20460 [Pedobacter sp. PACM 27299]